jgi:arylformamidase
MATESPSQDPKMRAAIARLGCVLGPAVLAECTEMFRAAQERLAVDCPRAAADVPYGDHERQRLDVYLPQQRSSGQLPVLVWVHGGGFVRGEKYSPTNPFNAHVGRWAARNGFMGVVVNYRLAPQAQWPSGGEDVAAVIAWLERAAVGFGGDAQRIVLAGTSAGAAHIGTYLQFHAAAPRVRGAVLLSGLYGATPLSDQDLPYYGRDAAQDEARVSLAALAAGAVPLFVACAELDPPRFQAETLALLQQALQQRGKLPRTHVASGHNHYTMAMHLGTADARLSDEILSFATECIAA